MRRKWTCPLVASALFVLIHLCGCGGGSSSPEAPDTRPNFVFILIDDLGWMDVGYQGSPLYETPNIDRLASEGVRFSNAYAASPYCSPTRASIQAGKYPVRMGINCWIGYLPWLYELDRKLIGPPHRWFMGLEEVTLAEAFREAGYATGIIGKWHLGTGRYYPEHQGYEVALANTFAQAGTYFYPYSLEVMADLEEGEVREYLPDRLADETMKFISESVARDRPFFVFHSNYAMHSDVDAKVGRVAKYKAKLDCMSPYEEPRFVEEGNPSHASGMGVAQWQENPVFAAMIESIDENVGRILDHLGALGIADNTVVLFLGDNGGQSTRGSAEPRHGVPDTVHDTSNAPLRGGKGYLFEGGIREPMVIKWPGVTRQGSVCAEPVVSTDFYPTMLEMARLPLRTGQHLDGVSLAPLLKGEGGLDRDAIFWHMPYYGTNGDFPGSAVRCGNYKLIEFFDDESVVLYDLSNDIGESRDLSEQMPKKTADLLRMLHDWRDAVDAPMMRPNPLYRPPTE